MSRPEVQSSKLFNRDAEGYDDLRRRLIPCFDDFYGTALKLIEDWQTVDGIEVLDLGAGTGLFSAMVSARCSVGRLCLLDGAAGMLEQARSRFPAGDRIEYRVDDMAEANLGDEQWNLVISALAIHHLPDEKKCDLYRRIRRALKPGGLFVNAEQVAGPNPTADDRYSRLWLEQIQELGVTEQEIERARERMSYDKCAPVGSQLQWLADAGFFDVDCSFKAWRFAVFSGCA